MSKKEFSNWFKWSNRNNAENINFPGIYVIAVTTEDIENEKFNWLPEIAYVGMTNSKAGLKSRLKQFDYTIIGKRSVHGGADRFRYKYQSYDELVNKLYVSVIPFECDVKTEAPKDLRIMGEVCKFEYDCLIIPFKQRGSKLALLYVVIFTLILCFCKAKEVGVETEK